MLFYLPFLLLFYIALTGILYFYWIKIPVFKSSTEKVAFTQLSVLIAVRNEADTIALLLKDLEKQSYSNSHFEVLVLDDHSEDATFQIVQNFMEKTTLHLRLLKMQDGVFGKKNAISEGVKNAVGMLIVTTDGDCRVGTRWLESIEYFHKKGNVKMITGGVAFLKGNTLREKILQIEFASLIGSGAASLAMGYPNMCNGANLAYEKEAFLEVGGYGNADKLASGDDEFLMHKIYRKYPGQVAFLKNKEAVVETQAPSSWKAFFNQRVRWASKWESYTYWHIKLLAFLIFGSNLALILNFVVSPMESYPLFLFLAFLMLKFLIEFLFLRSVLVYFGRKLNLMAFLVTEMLYPFYVVLFALLGRTGKYRWKDREISS
ncbi:MAG TPA: glycosyltransferase [Cytophagaceae bacterium]|jgi:biofilm PGA synthesis N-glycosyltransferase PgaC|nr:glycosyltransferase [Cytophagaceae bacterium]